MQAGLVGRHESRELFTTHLCTQSDSCAPRSAKILVHHHVVAAMPPQQKHVDDRARERIVDERIHHVPRAGVRSASPHHAGWHGIQCARCLHGCCTAWRMQRKRRLRAIKLGSCQAEDNSIQAQSVIRFGHRCKTALKRRAALAPPRSPIKTFKFTDHCAAVGQIL